MIVRSYIWNFILYHNFGQRCLKKFYGYRLIRDFGPDAYLQKNSGSRILIIWFLRYAFDKNPINLTFLFSSWHNDCIKCIKLTTTCNKCVCVYVCEGKASSSSIMIFTIHIWRVKTINNISIKLSSHQTKTFKKQFLRLGN